ncbi:DUF4399 domain-containing protein [Haloterrigena salifodinae]|uniref:DUF4399 domain-containing protein n=1 Tax=Haloterrigena salifodinae TaxID=2675099 RepID=A0A8T8DYF0_9EURY|nr:DUF4399 domain-containing protein [Haloterrigena salifodinae]QRV14407.1 DUF4399 domain-containing protein [Haloterrigena salifodinae]
MTRTPTRRQYLTASAVAGVAAIAGCGGDSNEDEGPDENETDDEPVENVNYSDPEGELAFVDPQDGAEVSNPVGIEMEVENFELQPVGEDTTPENGAGHLHVIVDEGCVEPEYVIPLEDGFYHLSDGELETELELEPGEHDLCAQAGDAQHNAYDMTDEISITVTEGDGGESGNESADGNGNESDGESNSSDE